MPSNEQIKTQLLGHLSTGPDVFNELRKATNSAINDTNKKYSTFKKRLLGCKTQSEKDFFMKTFNVNKDILELEI